MLGPMFQHEYVVLKTVLIGVGVQGEQTNREGDESALIEKVGLL